MKGQYIGNGRNSDHCIACGSENLSCHWNLTSSFFAERALSAKPSTVALLNCCDCRTKYFDLLPSEEQIGRLYSGYRDENYFRQRNRYEPWYTRAINDDLGGEAEMTKRRSALIDALTDAGITQPLEKVLDHGGDRGQMMKDLQAPLRAVFEISGVETEDGIETISEDKMRLTQWDLILSCHVLEHLIVPSAYVKDLVSIGGMGTVFFIEVPNEAFKILNLDLSRISIQKIWVSWIAQHPTILKLFDFLSTAIRGKLNLVPPLLFIPLREHLTFFSIDGLTKLLEHHGLKVLSAAVRSSGHICVVAVKA